MAAFTALIASSGNAVANDPPTLPPVEVVGTRPSGWTVICTGMGCADFLASLVAQEFPLIDLIFGGGGDAEPPAQDVPDSPLNENEANCTSDMTSRRLHAMADIRHHQLARMAALQPSLRGPVRVTYDDGGTEVWTITDPRMSDNLLPGPNAGTLTCP